MEHKRIQVLTAVISGEVTVAQAAGLMELSERHAWRLLAAYSCQQVCDVRGPDGQARRYSRRKRYPREGMLLQVDGSRHDWLQGQGPYLTLVGAIDDATGEGTDRTGLEYLPGQARI